MFWSCGYVLYAIFALEVGYMFKQKSVIRGIRKREREKVREINESEFWKCIWEIRTDNPSLAVKILNGTPRPTLPSEKAWLEIARYYIEMIFSQGTSSSIEPGARLHTYGPHPNHWAIVDAIVKELCQCKDITNMHHCFGRVQYRREISLDV